jgi:hypothetical protein
VKCKNRFEEAIKHKLFQTRGQESGDAVVKKIRLNDEQWNTLQALFEAHTQRLPTDAIKVSERLRSNGLVTSDRQGGSFLTEQGRRRLSQGR